jgi:hypothetical protein
MKTCGQLQTMAQTFQEICQGETPWVALGNFMNDWFDYAKDQRTQLVATPIFLPPSSNTDILRWATFCAASVEWLCDRYSITCPEWVENPAYVLSDPWFDSPGAHKPQVRERLIRQTPEPFTRRNIYCGNRMFNNKYEFADQYRQRLAIA